MKWIVKALTQKCLSALPRGEYVNYQLQKYVTRSIPVSDQVFRHKVEIAIEQIRRFAQYSKSSKTTESRILEFGAGWVLIGPLVILALGFRNQITIDIVRHTRLELIWDTIRRMRAMKGDLERMAGSGFALNLDFFEGTSDPMLQTLEGLGLSYRAPLDIRNTGFEEDSFDLIINTSTLEHIPFQDVVRLSHECRRILCPGGILSCAIDLSDHYAHFDPSISIYNFMKFSDSTWRIFNSRIQFQNRLRVGDYIRIFRDAGFGILELKKYAGSERDISMLGHIRLNHKYRGRDFAEDIAPRRLDAVLEKM